MLVRIYILSRITCQQLIRQPVYYLVLFASAALLFIASPLALFAFGKESTMIREVGLATITFANIIIAIMGADFIVAGEIEKQTVLLTLTKPLRRSEFIIGKFLGLVSVILLATVFLTLVFLLVYWLKDGASLIKEKLAGGYYLNNPSLIWKDTYQFFFTDTGVLMLEDGENFARAGGGLLFIKGSYACFLEVTVIAALAILLFLFFSLPLTAGCIVVFFALSHILPYFHSVLTKRGSWWLAVPARIIYTALPDLTNFNLSSQVAILSTVSLTYLGLITLYAGVWSIIILLLAIFIFRRYEIK